MARIDPLSDPRLSLAIRVGALCNDARIDRTDGGEFVLGDPTEAALLVAAEKAGMTRQSLHRDYPRIDEVPFDSHTKKMVTIHRGPAGSVAFIKGSPGTLLDMSCAHMSEAGVEPLTAGDRERYERWNRELGGAALRVLGLAYRELPENYSHADFDRDFVFVGLVGMIDPLRDGVKDAIATCRQAGIRTLMITGDQPPTAAEIGRQLGLDRDHSGGPLAVVHARELEGLDDQGLERVVSTTGICARVSPKHKLQLVQALQRRGEIVAMTGDGVNDAPALKQADIGVAMGIKGTEVAKETADMIITDDNFATIVSAVEQGRIIYANILKFIHYLFSCNFAEILTVFVAILIGWPLPLGALPDPLAEHGHGCLPRPGAGARAIGPRHDEATASGFAGRPRQPAVPRSHRVARGDARGAHADRIRSRVALARDRARRRQAGRHDGVPDARPRPGRPRIQRAFPASVGVHRPVFH